MIRVILLILIVLLILAIKYLPLWANLAIVLAVILLVPFVARHAFLWLFSIPFRAKGKVLRGAGADVHSVRLTTPPAEVRARLHATTDHVLAAHPPGVDPTEDDVEDDDTTEQTETDTARNYYELDVTITPRPATGPFTHWEYGEVTLVRPGRRWHQDDDICVVKQVDLVREGTVLINAGEKVEEDGEPEDLGSKVFGPHRLRMLIGVKPGVRELVFGYYFEKFGRVTLPEA